MPLHVSSTCVHHQEVKIALHSLWYHQTYRWPSRAQVYETATYRFDDTRGCVMQFWPPDDEHMCSKHVEAWNKFIVKQKFCASSWLITEIKKRESQRTYNLTLRCVLAIIAAVEEQQVLKIYSECVFVALVIQYAMRMRRIVVCGL